MGMIGNLVRGAGAVSGLGEAAKGLSEVFVPNATAAQALEHAAHRAALDQLSAEFARDARGVFDRVVDGLNRLPRPLLALGTLGLFGFAMVAPVSFAARMEGLAYVPDPLWWLLGAIVSFYFGARELHYLRAPRVPRAPRGPAPALPAPRLSSWQPVAAEPEAPVESADAPEPPRPEDLPSVDPTGNPALAEWLAQSGR